MKKSCLKELQKMNENDLYWICKELGVKCSKHDNKSVLINKLTNPLNNKKTYKMDTDTKLSPREENICPICLEPSEDKSMRILECNHSVCTKCWDNWMSNRYENAFCPLCRKEDILSYLEKSIAGNSGERLKEFADAFSMYMKDNGTVDTTKIIKIMNSLDKYPTEVNLQSMINKVDINSDGFINFQQFLNIMYMHFKDEEIYWDRLDAKLRKAEDMGWVIVLDTRGQPVYKTPCCTKCQSSWYNQFTDYGDNTKTCKRCNLSLEVHSDIEEKCITANDREEINRQERWV